MQSAISDTVVAALDKAGLPAELAPSNAVYRPGDLVVTGHVSRIDEGNRTRRMGIGFGAGKSIVEANAQLYAIVANGPPVLLQTYDGTADSGRKPGLAVGASMAVANASPGRGRCCPGATNISGEIKPLAGRQGGRELRQPACQQYRRVRRRSRLDPGLLGPALDSGEARRLLLLAASLLGVAGVAAAPGPNDPAVTVVRPKPARITRYLETTGTVAAMQSVDLFARVSGTLESIGYADGAIVPKGTTLFTIEPLPYESKLRQAQAAEDAQRALSAQADAEYARQAQFRTTNVASQSTVDTALATRDSTRAALRQAEEATKQAAITYTYTRVTAPFDGVVTAHLASVGELVGMNGPTKLATILQLDPIWVNASISEADVTRARATMAARGKTLRDLGTRAGRGAAGRRDRLPAPRHARLRGVRWSTPRPARSPCAAVFDNAEIRAAARRTSSSCASPSPPTPTCCCCPTTPSPPTRARPQCSSSTRMAAVRQLPVTPRRLARRSPGGRQRLRAGRPRGRLHPDPDRARRACPRGRGPQSGAEALNAG